MTMTDPEVRPGSRPTASEPAAVRTGSIWRSAALNAVVTLGWFVLSVVSIALLWQLAVQLMGLGSFGAKSPTQVLAFLLTDPDAAENRRPLVEALATTSQHAGLGFVSGVSVGLLLALGFVLVPLLERPLMPIILLTQSLPVLAVLPLFILMLGRGYAVTVVITTLATFFPMFVMASQGLQQVGGPQRDYFRSLDASSATTLLRLRIPSAVPFIFAALKVCVPSAMFGAIVSEWLATGDGLGYLMVNAAASAGSYHTLWAAVGITTVVTMATYTVLEVVEQLALGRFAPEKVIGGQRG